MYNQRHDIQLDPTYQREGDIWSLDKRQLLIDSVLNGYDIPKIYFHEFFPPKKVGAKKFKYAIVDGKQRLQTLWDFIDGKFSLHPRFEFFRDPTQCLAGLTYAEIGEKFPRLKAEFDGTPLDIVTIQTDDIEKIEDMFSRLNEAVPLNAPEKRNALGGPLPPLIRKLSRHKFFQHTVAFSGSRYRHLDLATKYLYLVKGKGPADTKKAYLDAFVRQYKDGHFTRSESPAVLYRKAFEIVTRLSKVFTDNDPLLKSVGMTALYFLLALDQNGARGLKRSVIMEFEKKRADNAELAEKQDVTKARWDLLEFDRLSQSPNDKIAMDFRLKVLKEFVSRHA